VIGRSCPSGTLGQSLEEEERKKEEEDSSLGNKKKGIVLKRREKTPKKGSKGVHGWGGRNRGSTSVGGKKSREISKEWVNGGVCGVSKYIRL